jgi:ribose-phosphate pyrophosphokinase
MDKIAVFSGNAHPELAKAICKCLKVKLSDALVSTFSEGEIRVKINDNVRGKDVFIVQPTCPPSNDTLMELLIMIDALKRASAMRITAVMPYFGYARQDRKDQPRVPITAKLVANLITTAGADRVITMDLHASQIQGFFDIPLDHLFAVGVFIEYLKKIEINPKVLCGKPVIKGTRISVELIIEKIACGYSFDPSFFHQPRIDATANSLVSWSVPTLTNPVLRAISYIPYGYARGTSCSGKS